MLACEQTAPWENEALTGAFALDYFASHLAELTEQRAAVQATRRLSDSAIAPHRKNGSAVNTMRIVFHRGVGTVGPTGSPFKPFEVGAGLVDGRRRKRWPDVENPNVCKPAWC